MPVLTRPIARIYTPPTCTLEVTAQPSALSRWTHRPAVKSLQFLLRFEGLSQGDRDPIEVRGNQTQLTNLVTAVSDYLQTLIARRPSELPLQAPREDSAAGVALAQLPALATQTLTWLRPRSLLNHELILGSLINERSGPSIILKVSQLYDLAAALDDYTTEFQELSALASAPPSWRTALPLARSAAVVVLGLGLGTTLWRLSQPGFVAVNESTRSPNTTTALAPSAPSNQALPSLQAKAPTPLALPTIQLPSRTPSVPSAFTQPAQKTGSQPNQKQPLPKPAQRTPQPKSNIFVAERPNISGSSEALARPSFGLAPAAPLPDQGRTAAKNQTLPRRDAASEADRQNLEQSSLFDTIPQVAEVRDYVSTRWHPASPPAKILEYRLKLKANGSLAQVEPLGASAQRYLPQLSLPAPQSPFVSAVSSGSQPIVRLVLSPDGAVQTFLDQPN